MDLPLDPLSSIEPMAPAAATPHHSAYAANPTPTNPAAHNHPPYAEMITAAIAALNERNGSSKKAIVKYIESHYWNLPPTHSSLLTHHLKRLKNSGQILMVKYSYRLPRSGVSSPVSANGTVTDSATSVGSKKRPGRPPKAKSVQAAVPVFAQQDVPMNDVPVVVPGLVEQQNAAVGPLGSAHVAFVPGGGPSVSGVTRGRGRPPKQGASKLRPPKSGGVQTGGGRGRGRPKKIATPPAARVKRLGRSRGRPRKVNNPEVGVAAVGGGVVGPLVIGGAAADGALPAGSGIVSVAGKRRGRPPKAGGEAKRPRMVGTGEPKKPRKLGGKPLGRPKKLASGIMNQPSDNQLLMAYLDVKGKLEYFQSRIKQTVGDIKPYLNNEATASALQELETLANMEISSSNVQPQPQTQPQS
ncbi:uncharacterized protein LOC142556129 [Primulina tabacum]|uniref:uncharacterized protein LOC142556129 n=1 Tax=Primulina tabacum TaxID=48773 RepID=UPI003F5A6D6B